MREEYTMIYVVCIVLTILLDLTYGVPPHCHTYYSEFTLHDEYNKNIDPEINITISEKSYLYNIVEVIIVYNNVLIQYRN